MLIRAFGAYALTAALLVGAVGEVTPPLEETTPPRSEEEELLDLSAAIDGSGLDLTGKQTNPGSPGSSGEDTGQPPSDEGPPQYVQYPEQCMVGTNHPVNNTLACSSPSTAPGEDPLPAVTITDVARFVPTTATVVGEPGNVGVKGRATNFVSDATTEVVEGTLFSRALSVQFTPTSFTFDYGDSTVIETASGGASWQSLGLAQFTPTDTSHVYSARGTYNASVTVTYSAHINFGTGWLLIPGTVTGPAATRSIQIFEARNMLVNQTCDENPGGIGC